MKNTRFSMAAIRKFKPSKYINKKELALIVTAASVLFVSNACSPSDPNTSLVDVNPTAIKQQQQKAAEIESPSRILCNCPLD